MVMEKNIIKIIYFKTTPFPYVYLIEDLSKFAESNQTELFQFRSSSFII